MERRSWCPLPWDMIGHVACDSYFDTTGESASNTFQNADYDNPDCQAVPEAFIPISQSMHEIPCEDEMTPLEVVQYNPEWAPITAQKPEDIFPGLVPSERSPMYHSHRQRTSQDTRTSKEDEEMPERRRAQNRKAQRAFRKRREEYIRNLNDQLSRITKQHQTLLEADLRQANSMQNLKMQIATLNARLDSLRGQRDPSSSSPPTSEMLHGFLPEGGEYVGGETSLDFEDFATNKCTDFALQSC